MGTRLAPSHLPKITCPTWWLFFKGFVVRYVTTGPMTHVGDSYARSGIAEALGILRQTSRSIPGQRAGALLENLTREFIEHAFAAISHMRHGNWKYLTSQTQISRFAQYCHLKALYDLIQDDRD